MIFVWQSVVTQTQKYRLLAIILVCTAPYCQETTRCHFKPCREFDKHLCFSLKILIKQELRSLHPFKSILAARKNENN